MTTELEPEETIQDIVKMMRSELGSKSILFAIACEEFVGKELTDITEEMFFEILNEAKATEEDSEIFLSCLQSFDIYDVQEWEIDPEDLHICTEFKDSNNAMWEGQAL